MFNRRSLVVIAAAALPGVAKAAPAQPPMKPGVSSLASKLIGTWKLVRYEDIDASGKYSYPFGENPGGYFVYDATGHLSVQIMRTPPMSPLKDSADWGKPTVEEAQSCFEHYCAYYGTYEVDEKNLIVTHVVEGALSPNYTGTRQPRPFRLEGDVLTIGGKDPDGSRWVRELHRVL